MQPRLKQAGGISLLRRRAVPLVFPSLLILSLTGCSRDNGHCFDPGEKLFTVAYEIELGERLSESTCEFSVLAPGSRFTVQTVGSYLPSPGGCKRSALALIEGFENQIVYGLGYGAEPWPQTITADAGGTGEFSIFTTAPGCDSRLTMRAGSPVETWNADDLISAGQGMLWAVSVADCRDTYETMCTEYFTSTMKKISWPRSGSGD